MYIYRLYDENKNIIYVGKTINEVKYRIRTHFTNQKNYKTIKQLWKYKVSYFDYVKIKNKAELCIYEVYLINKIKPKYNFKDKGKGKVGFTLPKLNFCKLKHVSEVLNNYNYYKKLIKEKYLKLKNNSQNSLPHININLNAEYEEKGYKLLKKVKGKHKNRNKLIFSLMYYFGLKISEIKKIKNENIDFDKKLLKLENRVFKLDKNTFTLISFYKNRNGYIFKSQHNKIISSRTIQLMLKKYLQTNQRTIRNNFKNNILNKNKRKILGLVDTKFYSRGNKEVNNRGSY